jgi:hypothetical protein
MKYLKSYYLLESIRETQITKKCELLGIKNWTLNSDGLVDVNGNVDISKMNLTTIPLRFGEVTGEFSCFDNKLTNLDGAPHTVGGAFYCYGNLLTSLVGGPKKCLNYNCASNKLENFVGAPERIPGFFFGNSNKLLSLKGSPKYVGDFFIERVSNFDKNKSLLFEDIPTHVSGNFYTNNSLLKLIIPDKKINSDDIELLEYYDFVRREGVIIDRLIQFLEDSQSSVKKPDKMSESFWREKIIKSINNEYKIID